MIVFDWLLILLSSLNGYTAYKRVCFQKNASSANYVILMIYLFCVIPILMNYLMGVPTYDSAYWYKVFINPMNNADIGIIYDVYIFCTFICLEFFVASKSDYINRELRSENSIIVFLRDNKFFYWLLLLSPVIMIIRNGTVANYMIYATTQQRGLSEVVANRWVTPLLLMSLVLFFSLNYKGRMPLRRIIISALYFIIVVWISGKRFIFANIFILFIFYYTNMDISRKNRKRIFRLLPILIVALVIFSGIYLAIIKPAQIQSDNSVYDMLRVDFGRDDVIKYVIDKEFFNNQQILEYRGQSFLSLIFDLIPRSLWHNKPYPHYMYLTSSILGLPLDKIFSGTTPCWLEMSLCNFSYLGFPIAIFVLCIVSRSLDKSADLDIKGIGILLLSVLLTQSIDVYFTIVVLMIALLFFRRFRIGHKIKNVFSRRR